jgi:hypothetical protein
MKSKILLWINGPLYFSIAYQLQKMYDCEIYAVFDITNKPKKFFLEQKLVKFKKIWFYHDHIKKSESIDFKYLETFEKKYNINLWKLAINERIFYRFYDFHNFSAEEILSIEEDSCKLFESILNEVKPKYFLSYIPNLHHVEIFYELCIAQGIKTLILSNPILGYGTRISEARELDDSLKRFNETKGLGRDLQTMKEYLYSFDMSKSLTASYGKTSNGNLMKSAFEFLFSSDNKHEKTHYTYFGRSKFSVLKYSIELRILKKRREKFMEKNLLQNIDLETRFVYFPLGVEPEANILIKSPFFTNQIEVIRNVAKSLPVGYQLYVKESPSQVNRTWRDISEYKEIMNIPNVKLIHPSFSNKKLLEKSSVVVTIVGTSGFEAAFYQKPSIVFGDTFYTVLPSVHRVKEIENLNNIIRSCISESVNPSDLDKFLVLLEEETFDFDLRGFNKKILEHFFNDGNLIDREIPESLMMEFLTNNKELLEKISLEHVNKFKKLDQNEK